MTLDRSPANSQPSVSVVVPLYNRADLVLETLWSIALQSLNSLEAIIVDDGSTDGGAEAVGEFCKSDPRFRLLRRVSTERGAPVCRNAGFESSTGDYIVFLDSDDLLSVDCLAERVAYLDAHENTDVLVSQGLIFEKVPGDSRLLWNKCEYSVSNLTERFLNQDMPWANGGATWRRSALRKTGSWNTQLRCFQDWELHLRACILGLQIEVLPRPDFYIRRTDSSEQISHSHNTMPHIESRIQALESIVSLLESKGKLSGAARTAVKAFVLRNYLSVCDAGQKDAAARIVNSNVGRRLLGLSDRLLLNWIQSHGPSWHWNQRVTRVAHFWWSDVPFDTARISSGFLSTTYDGVMPCVAINGASYRG